MPPHLLGIALAGAAAWAGYRWFRKESQRVRKELDAAEAALKQRREQPAVPLRRDPDTGVYTPEEG